MKVAIDSSPISSAHSVRGIGSYTQNLVNEFKIGEHPKINFEYFQIPTPPPTRRFNSLPIL